MSVGNAQSDMTLLLQWADDMYARKGSFEYLWEKTTYPGIEKFLGKGPNRVMFTGGKDGKFTVVTNEQNTTRAIGYFSTDSTTQQDFPATGTFTLHTYSNHCLWDKREILEARGEEAKLADVIQTRSAGLFADMTETLEESVMSQPANTTDTLTAKGIFYDLVPCTHTQAASVAAGAAGAFQGGNPYARNASQFSDCYGISAVTYSRWRNWCAQFSSNDGSWSVEDRKRLRRAIRNLRFKKPTTFKEIEAVTWAYAFYASQDRIEGLEAFLEASNENHGMDLGKYEGATTYNGIPVMWVPLWDDTTKFPVYADGTYTATSFFVGVNHNYQKTYVMEGDDFATNIACLDSVAHRSYRKTVDLTFGRAMRDRQKAGFVLAYTA